MGVRPQGQAEGQRVGGAPSCLSSLSLGLGQRPERRLLKMGHLKESPERRLQTIAEKGNHSFNYSPK